MLDLVLNSSNSRNPCNACLTQPSFGAEMFPPNQRSKLIFRKNAEHYVAYNALHAIYHDTISSNAARRYDDGCHVSRPLLFVACSFVAQDADATTACSSAVSTHVGVL